MSSYRPTSPVQIGDQWSLLRKRVSRYLPAYRIEGQKEDENGEASPFLLLKFVSDDVHWRITIIECMASVIGGYRRMNGRH